MSDLPPAPKGAARVFALGDLRILDAQGGPVASLEAQPKRAALLIYLACQPAGSFCPRDQLLTLFWPDFDDERARNSLRTSLYYVRRGIGPGVVNSRPDGALEADPGALWCDVRGFEAAAAGGRWAEAAELYRGDFLQGASQSVSVEFDHWVEATRRRLRRACADALYRMADEREREDDLDGALEAMGRARTLLPADEAILRKVLLLWARAGHRVRAVQEYQAFTQTLRDLYELEPSEETRQILGQVTGPAASPAPIRGESPRLPYSPATAPQAAPEVERGPDPLMPDAERPTGTTVGDAPIRRRAAKGALALRGTRSWVLRSVAVAALVTTAFLLGRDSRARSQSALPGALAVLPFQVTGGADLLPLAQALPGLLSDELRSGAAPVLDPQSLDVAGAPWEDQMSRARELGAGTVVTGQVIGLGDSVAILIAAVPTTGPPVPRDWGRVTGRPDELGALAAELGRHLLAAKR